MRTEKTRDAKPKKRGKIFFWYEPIFLIIIALLVFQGGDLIRFLFKGGLTGAINIHEVASIVIQDVQTSAGGAEGANTNPTVETPALKQKHKQVFIMNKNLLVRNGNKLEGYDVEGTKLSERQLNGRDTKILEYGDRYLIYEGELGIIALVGEGNQVIKELKLDKAIESIKLSKERIFVKPKFENSVLFLDSELNESGKIEIKNRELVFMEANFDNSELLCFSTEIVKNSLASSVIVYNKHQKVIASLDLNGAIMLDMHSASSIFLLTDVAIMNYSKDLKPLFEKAYDGEISLSKADANKLYFIMDKSMRAGGRELIVYNSEGEEAYLPLTSSIEHVKLGKKYILAASLDKISLLNYNIKVVKEINIRDEIEETDWIDDRHFYIRSGNKVIIYSL